MNPREVNLLQAKKDMVLTPQEESLYRRHLDNLYGTGKVMNSDGSVSTLYQMTVEHNGKTYSIPTVFDGKIVEPDVAMQKVSKIGWDKFPSYATPEQADTRYQQMHKYMDQDGATFLQQQRQSPSFKSITGATSPP